MSLDSSRQSQNPDRSAEDESEELHYAEAIIRTTRHPLLALNGDLTVQTANPAFYQLFQVSPEETEGQRIYDLGNGQWNIPELRRLLEEMLVASTHITDYRIDHEFEDIGRRTMLVNATRIERKERPVHVLLAISDVTEAERLHFELEAQKEYAEKIVDGIREGLLVLDKDLRVHSANMAFYNTFKVDPGETEGRLVYELGNGQWDIPDLRRLLEEILPEHRVFDDYEVEHDFQQLGHRVMLLNARSVDHTGMLLLAIRDVTEIKKGEAQHKVLVGELQHRVKNILANVRSLSLQTRRNSHSLDEFTRAFDGRIDALARAQNLLIRSAEGTADLRELLGRELDAHGVEEHVDFTLDGPEVVVSARIAQALEMAAHELATNAVKYGALSNEQGRVEVTWRVEPQEDVRWLHLRWRETGVSIENTAPEKSFGSEVIERSLPYMLSGSVDLNFHPDGVECVMAFPLPERQQAMP